MWIELFADVTLEVTVSLVVLSMGEYMNLQKRLAYGSIADKFPVIFVCVRKTATLEDLFVVCAFIPSFYFVAAVI